MYQRFKVRERPVPPQAPQEHLMKKAPAPTSHSLEEDEGNPIMEFQGVYIISVAARILDMHPQTLRKYERLGLINPGRTMGMLRLYSQEDIQKLRLIRHLVDNLGLNLSGVELTLSLVDKLVHLRKRLAAIAQGSLFESQVDREIDQVFRSLNLPGANW